MLLAMSCLFFIVLFARYVSVCFVWHCDIFCVACLVAHVDCYVVFFVWFAVECANTNQARTRTRTHTHKHTHTHTHTSVSLCVCVCLSMFVFLISLFGASVFL